MNKHPPPHKVLIAIDGSEQSIRAIRYAGRVFPPDLTQIVLFHVQEQLYDLFTDLEAYPHYKQRVTGLKRWATEQKMDICHSMDSALIYFMQKGFPQSALTVKTPTKSLSITKDIIKESYNGYHAVVVGRTGWSRFKDWLTKSTAMKLVTQIKHIPVVVVGGDPDSRNFLVPFDGTRGAMRAVVCIGALVRKPDNNLKLYSIIPSADKFWVGDRMFLTHDKAEDPLKTGDHKIGPLLEEARLRLLNEGLASERIEIKIHAVDRNRPARIVKEAMENNFGSIVVGRRGSISFIDSYFIGRVSDRILKIANQMAVWII